MSDRREDSAGEQNAMDLSLLAAGWLGTPAWMWLVFLAVVAILLILDLGVFHKDSREIGVKESLLMSAGYIGVGLLFSLWVWWQIGPEAGMNYLTGFAVEKALALDNIFVIAVIFSYFAIPRAYQHRVLFWGILGVIVLRGIMIGFGAGLVSQFSWVLYIFALFLIFTGIKMLLVADKEPQIGRNPVLGFIRRRFNVTDELHGQRFVIRRTDPVTGKSVRFVTPLFVALVLIEISDVIFAVDSIPAIFAITTDPFVVYTANIFAILGLRALYFALSAVIGRFHHLKYALAAVLIFIGSKTFVADWIGVDKFPPAVSLGVTIGLLVAGVLASLVWTRSPGGGAVQPSAPPSHGGIGERASG